jgi:hypothetical protein
LGSSSASVLAFWHMDFDSVNLGGHDDLAGQSGRFPALVGEFQNIVLIGSHGRQALSPRRRHVNVTSGASALTAAIAIDTRHGVIGGSAHQVLANLGLNATAYTVKADEMNLGHGQKSFLKNQNSGIS